MSTTGRIADVLQRHEKDILSDWLKEQFSAAATGRSHSLTDADLREQSRGFLSALRAVLVKTDGDNFAGDAWAPVRQLLGELSRSRALGGYSSSETATFIFSLKKPLFERLRAEFGNDAAALAEALWQATQLLDRLGLYTTEIYIEIREGVIERQQRELLELSTPVVELWQDIVALPLVGTLDSQRTQIVMETLLQKIVQTGAAIAIIDITGVPTVDTLVAQHLLKTVAATRLMGADCIISGIRPQIAQTIVHLGVNLGEVTTKASLADAFQVALKRVGSTVNAKTESGMR
jgi:rsbT co-antagonist protein RsbR